MKEEPPSDHCAERVTVTPDDPAFSIRKDGETWRRLKDDKRENKDKFKNSDLESKSSEGQYNRGVQND